jgi:ABC-2 type transport system permease protein
MTSAATEPPRVKPVKEAPWSRFSAIAALFRLTVRQHTHGRRMFVLALLYLLPCGLAILLRSLPHPAPIEALEFALIFNLLPHALAPLTALLYAAGTIQDEVEEQTLTYLLMRSVPRWALYVTKLVATCCVTTVLVSLATIALYTSVYAGTPEFTRDVLTDRLPRVLAIMALAQVGYCAVFGFIGLAARRSLIVGLIFIVFIEGMLSNLDFILRAMTIVHYVRTLVLRWLALPEPTLRRMLRDWSMDMETLPTAEQAVQRLVLTGLIGTALGAWWFTRREFRVKTPEGS